MSCINNINTNCGCENNPCGCGTSSDDVVYQGPDLSCTGITNCDTLTQVITNIDDFICGPGMVETIINNIINNTVLYNQFTTIVNNTVDCETVWGCETTTTTTTVVEECHYYTLQGATNPGIWSAALCNPGKDPVYTGGLLTGGQSAQTPCIVPSSLVLAGVFIKQDLGPCPTTTTTTTVCTACTEWFWQASGGNSSALEYLDCDGVLIEIPIINVTNSSGYICTENGSAPTWNPAPTLGSHTLSQQGCCDTTTTTTTATPTTTTTSTTIAPTTTTTTTTSGIVYSGNFSVATENNALACLETTAVMTLYSSSPTFAFGSFVYTDIGLTTIFDGGNLYYKNIIANNGIRVPASGQINNTFSC